MNAPPPPVPVRLVVILGALVLGISGCRLMSTGGLQGARTLSPPGSRDSVLVIITNPHSTAALRATGALVEGSVRPSERVVILGAQSGAVLVSSRAPSSPTAQVPAPPAPLAPHPTSFQKARHAQAVQQYQGTVLHTRAALQKQQQETFAAWARSIVAKIEARAVLQDTQEVNINADLSVAASDLA